MFHSRYKTRYCWIIWTFPDENTASAHPKLKRLSIAGFISPGSYSQCFHSCPLLLFTPAFRNFILNQERSHVLKKVVHLPSCACQLPESSGCCHGTAASQMCSLARESKKEKRFWKWMQYALRLIYLTALGSQILLSDTNTHIGNAI